METRTIKVDMYNKRRKVKKEKRQARRDLNEKV